MTHFYRIDKFMGRFCCVLWAIFDFGMEILNSNGV